MYRHGPALVGEYVPGRWFYAVMALATVALVSVGFAYGWNHTDNAAVGLWLPGLLVLGVAGPCVVQYVLLRRFGVRPRRMRWGDRRNAPVPRLIRWWETENEVMTTRQFAAVYAVPALLVCATVLLYAVRFPISAPVVGFVWPFYLGNFWLSVLALQEPKGTLVEDTGRGVRFYQTAHDGVPVSPSATSS